MIKIMRIFGGFNAKFNNIMKYVSYNKVKNREGGWLLIT